MNAHDPAARSQPLHVLIVALASIYATEFALLVLDTLVSATIASPSSIPTPLVAIRLLYYALMPIGGVVFLFVVHRVGTTAEAAGLPLRSSPRSMVWNYFHPIYAVLAPAGDLIDVDRFAGGDDVDYDAPSPNQWLIRTWWTVRLCSALVVLGLDLVDDASTSRTLTLAFVVGFHVTHLLSIAMFVRLDRRLRGVERSESAWPMTPAQNP